MGCTASKVKNAEDVARCRARRRLMKQAVSARHQFAAAHAVYIQAMKNVGAAFRQFGETELRDPPTATTSTTSAAPRIDSPSRPLPPPPPPVFLPPPSPTSHYSVKQPDSPGIEFLSPPASPPPKGIHHDHQEEDDEEGDDRHGEAKAENEQQEEFYYGAPPPPPVPPSTAPPPPSPPRSSAWDFLDPFRPPEPPVHLQEQRRLKKADMRMKRQQQQQQEEEEEAAYYDEEEARSNVVRNPLVSKRELQIIVLPNVGIGRKELVEVVREVDDLFMRAHENAKEVSKLLEARKVHYHSNFVDSKGYDSHSRRVLQAISWGHRGSNKSPMALRVVAAEDDMSGSDEGGSIGSHAATLDRLLAWEKKLYNEVKATEATRVEYRKKCGSLKAQSKGQNDDTLERNRATIKALYTRIQVSLQAVDTAVSAINKLKEGELHPQLLQLLEGLMNMWHELCDCHQKQHRIVAEMKAVDHWGAVDPTTNLHRVATTQLESAVEAWYSAFNKLVAAQREYMHNLTGWLRLSNMRLEMETNRDDNKEAARLPRACNASMFELCQDWSLALDRLPDKVASEAMKSFEAVIQKLVELQSDEVKHRKKVDALSKELEKKLAYLSASEKQQQQQPEAAVVEAAETTQAGLSEDNLVPSIFRVAGVSDRMLAVNTLKRKLDEEKEKVAKAVFDTRAMTINSLHTGLPSIFQAVAGFARISLNAYQGLYCQAHNGGILRITEG